MIQVAGHPFDGSRIQGDYSPGSVQRQVLDAMEQSTAVYRFGSADELRFELSMRKETVDAALAQNRSGLRFATFHESKCNPAYWERTANGGFQLKQGAVPSEAITDIFTNGRAYATECATAMVIIIYKAVLAVYGDALFNKTFPSIYLMDWTIRQPLLAEIGTPKKVPELLLGDRAYFMNEQVNPETSWWRGENVIVMPGDLYYGHGVGIQTAETIIYHLNRNRKKDATVSAYLMDKAARPNYQRLFSVQQRTESRQGPLVWSIPQRQH